MGYDRDTVSKYIRLERAKPATLTAGSATGDKPETQGELPADGVITTTVIACSCGNDESKPATPSPGSMIQGEAGGGPEFPGQDARSATPTAGSEKEPELAGSLAPTGEKSGCLYA